MADSVPLVSVVIPTYNRAEVLGRALRSVLAQRFDDFEVVVVDDASTDGTRRAVAELASPRVSLVTHGRRLGGGAARNTGIAASRGALVAFLDSDDEWRPDKLQRQVARVRTAGPDVGVVYTGRVVVGDGSESVRLPRRRGWVLRPLLEGNCVGTTSSVMVRRESLERVGGFDEHLASCQDWDLWIRLARFARFECVPEALVRYHEGAGLGRISQDRGSVVAGRLALLAKLEADPAGCARRIRAAHYLLLGDRCCHLGDARGGITYLLRALAAFPLEWRAAACAAAAVPGPRAYRSMVRARRSARGVFLSSGMIGQ